MAKIFITLTPAIAATLIEHLQSVLDGESTYCHALLLTDDEQPVEIFLAPDAGKGVEDA